MISVVVVNRDKRELLDECLSSIERATVGQVAEIIVIDNGSVDGSRAMVRDRHQHIRLIELSQNEGFAPAIVRATAATSSEWLLIVNNDAWVEPDALRLLVTAGNSDPRVGSVTAQVRFATSPNRINTAGLEIDNLGIAYDRLAGEPVEPSQSAEPVEVFGASGCVSAYRSSMLRAIGGFDASFFAYLEDADVAWRARMQGWRCLYEPKAVAYHHGSATLGDGSSMKYELVGRNRVRLIAKNATTAQLVCWGWAMVLYDLVYVVFVGLTERTLAPARGRARGLQDWATYRTAGRRGRATTRLCGSAGWLLAFRMRSAYRRFQ